MPLHPRCDGIRAFFSAAPMDEKYIEEFLHYILSVKGLSQRTAEIYGGALHSLAAFCEKTDGGITWESVDTDIVRRWMAALMERGVQPRTVRPMLAAVRTFYRYMLREGRVKADPVHKLMPPKAPKTLPQFLKRSEVEALLNDVVFTDDFEGLRNKAIVTMLCTTGIRAAEILGLCMADVDMGACQIKVTGKRNKQRIVPFGRHLKEALETYFPVRRRYVEALAEVMTEKEIEKSTLQFPASIQESGGAGYRNADAIQQEGGEIRRKADAHAVRAGGEPRPVAVFINKRGRPLRYEALRNIVVAALGNVTSLKKRSPHVLRHTFATLMLDNGADLQAIQQLLGHENVDTTEIYTHTSFAELRLQYAKAHPHARDEE